MTTIHITFTYLLILLFALFPVFLVGIAEVTGKWLGCNINEGGTDPCIRFGFNFGRVLNGMMVMGWLVLLTGPLALLAAIGFTTYLVLNN
ncbi:hypothetical protein [Neolewinella persica]|uniref:hypothetical protein n=1 Tax=Neolewinella persica TaxID=70998 RepID=UPI0003798F3C|nr:hypothetical protein [Neolewinella persica]